MECRDILFYLNHKGRLQILGFAERIKKEKNIFEVCLVIMLKK